MKNPTVKKITIIIIAIVAVAMVSLLTIFILKSFLTKNNSNANKKIVTILSSTEVISSFKTAGLSNDKYTKQANVPAIIQHKLDSELYGISLSSSVSIIYSTASSNKASDTNTIQTQTISYMTDNGFTEISPKIYNANKNIKYKTFKNNKTICQLMSTDEAITTGQSHFHQLSCIDNNSVTEQYSLIKKMFAINNSPKITSNPVQVLLISSSKENINYSILSVNSKATQQRLLFAAVDKNWEYLGDLIGGGKQYATEKSSITPELQIKINNSKYKGFLKENVLAN